MKDIAEYQSKRRMMRLALLDFRRWFRETCTWPDALKDRRRVRQAQFAWYGDRGAHMLWGYVARIQKSEAPVSLRHLPRYVMRRLQPLTWPWNADAWDCGRQDAYHANWEDARDTAMSFVPVVAEAVRQGLAQMPGCMPIVREYEGAHAH